jgi:DNA-binding NtrC family response regulator
MSELAHKHIVIADDETTTLRSLLPVFHRQECKVSKATTGKELFELIVALSKKKEKVDLVLSDIYLPEMTGWQVMDKLQEKHIHLPFLFMTGDVSRKTKVEFEKRDCSHFLMKPFTHKELLDAVKETLHSVPIRVHPHVPHHDHEPK